MEYAIEDNDTFYTGYKIKEKLHFSKSKYQTIEVVDTFEYGKMMFIDGCIMTTDKDEFVYHEMIAHVPVCTHPNPKDVLIIGGGDGGVVRELCKHPFLRSITLVEIDAEVIEISKQFFPNISKSLDNSKVTIHIEDGIEFVKNSLDASYDIVIVDSCDPLGPSEGLFTKEFYTGVKRILRERGIMCTQTESPYYKPEVFKDCYKMYAELFKNSYCYLVNIPTYPTGTWSLSYSSDICEPTDIQHEIANILQKENLNYWNPGIHQTAFNLPNFVKKLLY